MRLNVRLLNLHFAVSVHGISELKDIRSFEMVPAKIGLTRSPRSRGWP